MFQTVCDALKELKTPILHRTAISTIKDILNLDLRFALDPEKIIVELLEAEILVKRGSDQAINYSFVNSNPTTEKQTTEPVGQAEVTFETTAESMKGNIEAQPMQTQTGLDAVALLSSLSKTTERFSEISKIFPEHKAKLKHAKDVLRSIKDRIRSLNADG